MNKNAIIQSSLIDHSTLLHEDALGYVSPNFKPHYTCQALFVSPFGLTPKVEYSKFDPSEDMYTVKYEKSEGALKLASSLASVLTGSVQPDAQVLVTKLADPDLHEFYVEEIKKIIRNKDERLDKEVVNFFNQSQEKIINNDAERSAAKWVVGALSLANTSRIEKELLAEPKTQGEDLGQIGTTIRGAVSGAFAGGIVGLGVGLGAGIATYVLVDSGFGLAFNLGWVATTIACTFLGASVEREEVENEIIAKKVKNIEKLHATSNKELLAQYEDAAARRLLATTIVTLAAEGEVIGSKFLGGVLVPDSKGVVKIQHKQLMESSYLDALDTVLDRVEIIGKMQGVAVNTDIILADLIKTPKQPELMDHLKLTGAEPALKDSGELFGASGLINIADKIGSIRKKKHDVQDDSVVVSLRLK